MRRVQTMAKVRASKRRFAAVLAFAFAVLAALVAAPERADARASEWVVNPHSRVRLIAASSGVGSARELRLGLEFRLKKNWKVYWRSPGDAGFPPRIDWVGSRNLVNATIAWPAPTRFTVLGFNTAGYKDAVIFPVTVQLGQAGRATKLIAKVDYLTCDEICVPYSVRLVLDMPAGPSMTTLHAHQIDRYRARVPGDGAAAGLKVDRATLRERAKSGTLVVTVSARTPLKRPDIFVEGPPRIEFGKPKVALLDGGRAARLIVPMRKIGKTAPKVTGAALTLTLTDGARALEKVIVPEAAKGPLPGAGARSLVGTLLLALLGGLILNLMPCVLPVLSLKLFSVVSHGGAERGRVRVAFLATAAGVLAAFMVLAGAMVALKAAGASVGWGIQFQQPWFLVLMAVIVTLFAANLWGLFEIRLPEAIADRAARAGGGAGTHRPSLRGEFLTGAFATLLATPCSAPFLGTAVGFALSRGPLEIFAVFAALGVGLAAPYLLVAAIPALATRMPRPGRWMVWLRAVLGVALAATAVWLLWVLAVQVGATAAWAIGGLLLCVVGLLVARRLLGGGSLALAKATAAAVLLIWVLPFVLPSGDDAPVKVATGKWQRFERARIATLVSQGKTVFVDVTADWCLTCKANKSLVLGRARVARVLNGRNVVLMVADWTRPDPAISRYLAEHGRYGIPFNIVYGPEAPDGIALPEVLSASGVIAAIKRARGTARAERKD